MRLWSLHPRYLDRQGLTALWREGLLARAVLAGKTRGYRNHPQLERFREQADPLASVDAYLWVVQQEAARRGYRFDGSKLGECQEAPVIPVTDGQLALEWAHLGRKLEARSPQVAQQWAKVQAPEPHPSFKPAPGGVAGWERAG